MGGSSKRTTVGYQYYVGMHMVLCRGPIDYIKRIRVDDRKLYEGSHQGGAININRPNLFGGEAREGGVSGRIDIDFGGPTQQPNSYLKTVVSPFSPAFRTVVSVVLRHMYIGNNPYLKKWGFRASRIFVRQNGIEQWNPEYAQILRYVYNTTFNENFASLSPYSLVLGTLSAFNVNSGTLLIQSGFSANDQIRRKFANEASVVSVSAVFMITSTGFDDAGNIRLTDDVGNTVFFFNPRRQQNVDALRRPAFATTGSSELFSSPALNLFEEYRLRAFYSPFDNQWTFTLVSSATGTTVHSQKIAGTNLGKASYLVWSMQNAGGDGCTTVWRNVSIEVANADGDMNPAHIIRECLTDPDWGMGYPEEDIDDEAFGAAATTLFEEGFGLSLVWDRKKEILEFVEDVLRHIDAALYVSPRTGKFILKLIRADYDESNLIRLDEDSISNVEDYSQTTFGELVNSLSVVYYNAEKSKSEPVSVQDIALVQQQGGIIETTTQYPGITTYGLASRVAERDLKALSMQLLSCTVYADRTASPLNVGDAFILDWPELGLENLIMRAQAISYGNGTTNTIKVQCTQDVFDTPNDAIIGFEEGGDVDDTTALPAEIRIATEVPYYSFVQQQGEADAGLILDNNPFAGFAVVAAVKPNEAHVSGDLLYDDGSGYSSVDTLQFCPCGELISPLSPIETSFYLENVSDLDIVDETFNWCQIGSEIMRVDSIALDSSGYYFVEVGRGCLDTTPRPHELDSGGRYALFWSSLNGSSEVEYSYGEEILVKVLTNTGVDALDITEAPVDEIVFRSRLALPYPPGNLLIEGESYPDFVDTDSADYVTVSWAHRDRLQQTGGTIYDHTVGNIGPEPGVTYVLRLYDEFDILRDEQSGISGTSAPIDLSEFLSNIARVDVVSMRDGFESWMPASHRFEFPQYDSSVIDSSVIDSAGSDFYDSAGEEIDLSEGLKIWYTFDDIIDGTAGIPDNSGNGFGAIRETAFQPAKITGYLGTALRGNGSTFVRTASTGVVPSGDIFVSFWFKLRAAGLGTQLLFSQLPNSGLNYRGVFCTDAIVRVFTRNAAGDVFLIDAARPTEEVWHHLMFEVEGATLKFWLNNVLQGSVTVTGTVTTFTGYTYLFARSAGDVESQLDLDQIRIYNDTGKSEAFRQALYDES